MSRFRPMVSRRAPSGTHFAELFLAPGPHRIGETGDNSYPALFGRNWLLVWDRDTGFLELYQESAGEWLEVVEDLPPVFGSPAPAGSRRWSLAFDQAARVILAYEDAEGVVRVTRWDPSQNGYVQNVAFAGVDPCVVMDASWTYQIPGSDVLLFYLSPDRTRVLCRVQRDLYATEHELWDYGVPVILDRAIAAPLRYQLLVSDATGAPLPEALVSELYPVSVGEALPAAAALLAISASQDTYYASTAESATALTSVAQFTNVGSVAFVTTPGEAATASATMLSFTNVGSVAFVTTPGEAAAAAASLQGPVNSTVTTVYHSAQEPSTVSAGASLGGFSVQKP